MNTAFTSFESYPAPHTQPARKRPYRSSFAIVLDESAYKYRGQCKYKSGKCKNERTLKFNGEIHTLCEEHRLRHNRIQNKSDSKIRRAKRILSMYEKQGSQVNGTTTPDSTIMDLLYDSSTFDTASCDSDSSSDSLWMPDYKLEEFGTITQWSPEDTFIFQNIMGVCA